MTTQYTRILKLALPVTGELSGTWGDVVNDNITSMVEQAIAGLATINTWTANSHTLTTANGTTSESRCAMLVAQDGAGLTAAGEIVCPASSKLYVLKNGSSYAITLKTAAGSGVAVPVGETAFLFCDGTNVNACVTSLTSGVIAGNLTVSGNTTLGDSSADTLTVNARVASGLIPSADNTYDIGSSAYSWKDLYIDGTATLALAAISGGTINGVSIGATTPATFLAVDNISIDGNTIASTDTNGNIVLAPNGTGDVQVNADTLRVGDVSATATITTNGTGNLVLSTNAGTNSGTIQIAQGTNGNITVAPNGTGQLLATTLTTQLGVLNTDATLTTNGTGSLTLSTNAGTNSGTIQIAQGTNGTIALTPNGTGVTTIKNPSITGTTLLNSGTANTVQYLDSSKNLTGSTAFTFDGSAAVLNVSSANAALRITQTGAGNALLVEDSTNPDSTPFVVDTNGNVVVGATSRTTFSTSLAVTPIVQLNIAGAGSSGIARYSANANSNALWFLKTRGTTTTDFAVVSSGDSLGLIGWLGGDGTDGIRAASIEALVDGTAGTNDMPGRLVFSTTADGASTPSERMRIDSAGRVGIGTASLAGYRMRVTGTVTGVTTGYGVQFDTTAASDVTTSLNGVFTSVSTAAASFTLTNLRNYYVVQGTIGAGSTVTNQYGFVVDSSFVGGTNNFGYVSNIPSGSNRWNFYAGGTAQNYFAGNVLIGTTTTNTNSSALVVNGTISETVSSVQYLVASQYDVGTAPNKIPLNQYLGALAYRSNAMVAVPASATAAGNTGDVAMDSSYFYVCTAPNTWKRVAIATW